MAGEELDVAPATDPSAVDPSATPQPGAQPATDQAEPNVPFHHHPRWQQLMRESADLKSTNTQLQQQLQQIQQQLQTLHRAPQNGQPPSPEYVQAAEALLKIMEVNPRLKAILGLADAVPTLIQGYQGVQDLTAQQSTALLRSGRQEISTLATKAGLPADDDSVDLLEEMVAGVIRRTPGAEERFRQGDLGTVTEAFKKIQDGFVANLRKPAQASLIDTKNKVRGLPPAPRGGLPGGSAPPKLEPGKERQFEQSLHQRAMDMLANMTG